MKNNIQLLDCTLRDGCYIVEGIFGSTVIRGLSQKLQAANVDIIECGWLKDAPHKDGSAYYHVPADAEAYLPKSRRENATYAVMIDWDRYDLDALPVHGHEAINAIRMVFPHGKHKEALKLAKKIPEKGYRLFLQAANTLAYSDDDLHVLAQDVNAAHPESLSIVDTFGAMYPEDLERIFKVLDRELSPEIKLGFHSHNNQQLSFALTMHFLKLGESSSRGLIADASLCGMGRGAGNTTTELLASYLNRTHSGNYDLNEILDAIDQYLGKIRETHEWGYSIPYFIAGIYCSHVNNIAYLRNHHKTLAKDMRIIIESIDPVTRRQYDYGNLERLYADYQNKEVDDTASIAELSTQLAGRQALILAPGATLTTQADRIRQFIAEEKPFVIGLNSLPTGYACDCLFFTNAARFQFAVETTASLLTNSPVFVTSNVRPDTDSVKPINFNRIAKRGWQFFDNGSIMCLRLLAKLGVRNVSFAGFDGFSDDANDKLYANSRILKAELSADVKRQINADVKSMLADFTACDKGSTRIKFITDSIFA